LSPNWEKQTWAWVEGNFVSHLFSSGQPFLSATTGTASCASAATDEGDESNEGVLVSGRKLADVLMAPGESTPDYMYISLPTYTYIRTYVYVYTYIHI
jgi:hypothetical protein